MKTLAAPLVLACMTLAAGSVAAQDAMKKSDSMAKKEATMTMQECKDHMAMAKKEGMKKDDAMMKKDAMCKDMMDKDKMSTKKGG